jgi:hypothetical protein
MAPARRQHVNQFCAIGLPTRIVQFGQQRRRQHRQPAERATVRQRHLIAQALVLNQRQQLGNIVVRHGFPFLSMVSPVQRQHYM